MVTDEGTNLQFERGQEQRGVLDVTFQYIQGDAEGVKEARYVLVLVQGFLDHLEHGLPEEELGEIGTQRRVGAHDFRLHHRVEISPLVQDRMQPGEWLQAPAEFAPGALYPLGHGAAQPAPGGDQGQ